MADSFNYEVDTWKVVEAMFNQNKSRPEVAPMLFAHHISSFDTLVKVWIPQLISQHLGNLDEIYRAPNGPMYHYQLQVTDVRFHKPTIHERDNTIAPMYPREARLRGLTYTSPVFVDIQHRIYQDGDTPPTFTPERNVILTRIPVMVGSELCQTGGLTNTVLSSLGESAYDPGGYFIIKGNEKIVIPQEGTAENMYYCFKTTKGTKATKRSPDDQIGAMCQIKSTMNHLFYGVNNTEVFIKRPANTLYVKFPGIKDEVPLFVVFRAINISSDLEIFRLIIGSDKEDLEMMELLIPSCEEAQKLRVVDHEQAIKYMTGKIVINPRFVPKTADLDELRLSRLLRELRERFLPHAGTSYVAKAHNLAHMARIIINCIIGRRSFDDRDHLRNKRLDLVGVLMSQIIRSNMRKLEEDVRRKLQEHMESSKSPITTLRQTISTNMIESRIIWAISTGNWVTSKSLQDLASTKKGIAQALKRLSYLDTVSQLRRVQSPLDQRGAKMVQPRQYHASQLGHNCIVETPEGQQVGIVKNLACSAHVTIHVDPLPVMRVITRLGAELVSPTNLAGPEKVSILVNGNLYATVEAGRPALELYYGLRTLKRHCTISPFISISWSYEYGEILIYTDGGRYCRPLYIVDQSHTNLLIAARWREVREMLSTPPIQKTWFNLLKGPGMRRVTGEKLTLYNGGVLEYLDVAEQECNLIAIINRDLRVNEKARSSGQIWKRYTYCEIHPSLWHGVIASLIPGPDHQPAPRNVYQSSMGKQAISIYDPMFYDRLDTAHVLVYPQRPMYLSKYLRFVGMRYIHSTTQANVAIMSHSGFNQEDSLLINQQSLQRGAFNTVYYRSFTTELGRNEYFGAPPADGLVMDDKHNRISSYGRIISPATGLPILGAKVTEDDAIIGKYEKLTGDDHYTYRDKSVLMKSGMSGIIDKVIPGPHEPLNRNEDGSTFATARVSQLRIPVEGDKFASRLAQKGTGGAMFRQTDMPFSHDGFIPHIVMNPHAYPRRMTVSQLIEMFMSKLGLYTGRRYDCTVFNDLHLDDYQRQMEALGFQRYGDEVMYSGKTGEQLETECFVGSCAYQRLKHMVEDKMHSRSTGPIQVLTKQAAEGRSRDGGHKIGEMERDCLIAHGVAGILKERMIDCSDLYRVFVSRKTQMIINANPDRDFYQLGGRDVDGDDVVELHVPYAVVLFFRELTSAGILPLIKPKHI